MSLNPPISPQVEEERQKAQEVEDFLEEAMKRFEHAEQAETLIRERGLDDLRMRAGDQWDDAIKAQRVADGRPCMTVNRFPQFVRQVSNDIRQNRPSIMVSPVDDLADIKTAEILQGIIRHIEYDSGADAAYDQSTDHSATMGLGYLRVVTEYSDPFSFDLDIKIKRVRNPFSIYIDPEAKEADRSDMRWAFIVEDFQRKDFEARWPKAVTGFGPMHNSHRMPPPAWMAGDSVRVAEYYCMTTRKAAIALLDDGTVRLKERLPEEEHARIVKERETDIPTIRWCKITALEILEETEWPGFWIPVIPVLGDELEVDGKVILEGVIRHAKDTQKMLNVWVSAETEAIGLAPKAPFIVAEGQLEGREKEWKAANRRNMAYLTYKPKTIEGQLLPAPQRMNTEANVGAITAARMQSQDDMKALIGIYDSALGAHSNETSGVAIRSRQHQSNTANFHIADNLTRALRHLGRILVDLIPKVYDVPRVMRVIGEDGESKTVMINQRHIDPETGEEQIFNLGVGKYDVTVTAGPSYATKRQEAAASMMQFVQAYPPAAQAAGDLIVKNQDWPGAQEIADRLKKLLPPILQDDPKGKGNIPPQVQAQMAQLQQQIEHSCAMVEQLTKALNEAHDQMDAKAAELASKERIAAMQAQVELLKTWATLDQKDAAQLFQAELAQIQARLNLIGQNQPIDIEDDETPEPTPQGLNAEPPMAGGMPVAPDPEPATGAEMPGQPEPGPFPGFAHGLPGASDQGPSMETP